uniref:Uncharacterized protein n=1 Tax=Octopus bimaculoides TaxID=37653 RepID=A0A0L8G715_OCTBM
MPHFGNIEVNNKTSKLVNYDLEVRQVVGRIVKLVVRTSFVYHLLLNVVVIITFLDDPVKRWIYTRKLERKKKKPSII